MSKWLHPSARKYKTPMRDLTLEDAMSWKEIEKVSPSSSSECADSFRENSRGKAKCSEHFQSKVQHTPILQNDYCRMRKFFPTLMFARNDYLKSLNSFDHYQHQFAPPSPPAEGFRSIYVFFFCVVRSV